MLRFLGAAEAAKREIELDIDKDNGDHNDADADTDADVADGTVDDDAAVTTPRGDDSGADDDDTSIHLELLPKPDETGDLHNLGDYALSLETLDTADITSSECSSPRSPTPLCPGGAVMPT